MDGNASAACVVEDPDRVQELLAMSETGIGAVQRPNWRWQRICHLMQAGLPTDRARDDSWICKGLKYQLRAKLCHAPLQKQRLARRFPDIHGAVQLHDTYAPLFLVESRLLAGIRLDDVASACNLPLDAVFGYANLFFAVQQSLLYPMALHRFVIGDIAWVEFAKGRVGGVIKLFGLH